MKKSSSDGPIYHLYFAVRWWQEESQWLTTPFGEKRGSRNFPAVGDLRFTWLISRAGEGTAWRRSGQAPFWLRVAPAPGAALGLASREPVPPSVLDRHTAWSPDLPTHALASSPSERNVDYDFRVADATCWPRALPGAVRLACSGGGGARGVGMLALRHACAAGELLELEDDRCRVRCRSLP